MTCQGWCPPVLSLVFGRNPIGAGEHRPIIDGNINAMISIISHPNIIHMSYKLILRLPCFFVISAPLYLPHTYDFALHLPSAVKIKGVFIILRLRFEPCVAYRCVNFCYAYAVYLFVVTFKVIEKTKNRDIALWYLYPLPPALCCMSRHCRSYFFPTCNALFPQCFQFLAKHVQHLAQEGGAVDWASCIVASVGIDGSIELCVYDYV